jgi:class 3 adenylate cyclase
MRFWPKPKPLTIRRRVTLAVLSINLLFGINVGFYAWSNYRRKNTVEDLRRATTSQRIIGEVQSALNNIQKQVTLLDQAVVENAGGATQDEVAAFRAQFDSIRQRIEQLRQQERGEVHARAVELEKVYTELSASWMTFYENFGVHHSAAIMEMAMHSEPLSQQLLLTTLPALLEAERREADAATANYERVAKLTDTISLLLLLLSGLLAGVIAYRLTHYLTSALSELSLGASMIGASQFGHHIQVHAKDELGGLAQAFNDMSDHVSFAEKQLLSAKAELEQRHDQVESLLQNILPAQIAAELREKDTVEPKYYEDVTILFTDFVGFTLATESLAAEDLVARLHSYFTAFDQITMRYGIEKLKTIGDSYMCAGGMPGRTPSHPVDVVMAAFEMVRAVEELANQPGSPKWSVRIGIHSGPVIAGVVGIKKFAFDIWGESVNFSSRMESSSAANRINISERTHSRVKDFFQCAPRGLVATKEKRAVEMYFVDAILPELLEGGGVPPAAFQRRYQVYFQKTVPAFPDFLIPRGPKIRSA